MRIEHERRLLQAAVSLTCLVPLIAGSAGVMDGPQMVRGVAEPVGPDHASHFRYLSGLLLGIGIAFASCVPRIERCGPHFRLLGGIVIVGGLARALSLAATGQPGLEHQFGLAMELGTVPLLMAWQWRVERRWAAGRGDGAIPAAT